MKQEDFLDVQPLLENIKKNVRTDGGRSLDFASIFSFLFKSDCNKEFYVKHSVNGSYESVNVIKRGRPNKVLLCSLKQKYLEPVKIAKKKLSNVKSLLPYIPPVYHPFYSNLRSDADPNIDENAELIG